MTKLENVPAFKYAVMFAAGIYLSSLIYISIIITFAIVFILSAILVVFLKYNWNKTIVLITVYLLIFSGGTIGYSVSSINADNDVKYFLTENTSENIYLIGIVTEPPDKNENSMRILIDSHLLEYLDSSISVSGKTLVKVRQTKEIIPNEKIPELKEGDLVRLFGKLTLPPSERNPGEFDYKEYLRIQGIESYFIVSYFSDIQIISRENLGFLYQKIVYPARRFAVNSIKKHVGGDEGAYLSALVAGDRSNITSGMKDVFVNAGVMHILAVSGLNVAYVIISISLMLTLFRLPKIPKLIVTILLLGFYCMFTGSPASIIRASVMGSLILIAFAIQRKPIFYNITGFAALIILIFEPNQLFDPGFVLSFTAVLSMSFFYSRFENLFFSKINIRRKGMKKIFIPILALLIATFAAQIGVLPVSVIYFNKISLISLLTNLIAVPCANLSLAIGFIQVIANIFSDFLASGIGILNSYLLHFQISFIEFCAGVKFSYIEIYNFNLIFLTAYYLILIIIITSSFKKLPYRIVLSILILLTALVITYEIPNGLRLYYLYAGNSNCTYIRTPDGSNILIDFGEKNYFRNTTERHVIPFLKRQNTNDIDLLIISNPLKKNHQALKCILETFNVKRIMASKNISDKIESVSFRNKENYVIKTEFMNAGSYITGFGNTAIYVLSTGSTEGNNSLVFQLQYGNINFLFTGEPNLNDELHIIRNYSSIAKSDVFQASNNGNDESNTIPFITKVNPKTVIISSSYNEYRSDNLTAVLNRCRKSGAEVFNTGSTGAVIIWTDGISFSTESKLKK